MCDAQIKDSMEESQDLQEGFQRALAAAVGAAERRFNKRSLRAKRRQVQSTSEHCDEKQKI